MVANPFQVNLHDGEGQTILSIGDGTLEPKLYVELINNIEDTIVFKSSDLQKPHFELAFREGTLFEKNILEQKVNCSVTVFKNQPGNLEQKSNQQKCQSLSSNKPLSDNSFSFSYQNNSFFFFCNYKQNDQLIKLEKGEKLLFTLENISAEPAGGSRGTRVELKYQNGNLTYGTTSNTIIGNQLQYLNIVNQRGSKNLPMYVGFIGATAEDKASVVGSNRVLNDGETANTLILTFRYLNRLQDSPKRSPGKDKSQNSQLEEGLSLLGKVGNTDTATKFRITFDVLANKSPDSGYRLLRETNANAVKMKIYSGSTYLGVDVGSEQWDIRTDGQGNTRQWIITCKKDALNLTDEILRLEISDLKTELQAGYANLYVYYENIPGYWDGHIICPIEKGPLMLAKDEKGEESVGIGTNKPLAKLHIIQKKTTGSPALLVDQKGDKTKPAAVFLNGNVGIGTNDPKQALDVEGKIYVRKGVIQKGGDPITGTDDLGLYSLNKGDWMRLVTNNGPIRFFTDDKIGSTIRLSVEKDGNVGIGTTDGESALAKLDVRGSAIISEKLDVKGGLNVAGDSDSNVLSVEQTKGSKNTGYFKGGGGICIEGVTEGNGLYISSNSSSNPSLSVLQLNNSGKAAHFQGAVDVSGKLDAKGAVDVSGKLNAKDDLTIDKNILINSILSVKSEDRPIIEKIDSSQLSKNTTKWKLKAETELTQSNKSGYFVDRGEVYQRLQELYSLKQSFSVDDYSKYKQVSQRGTLELSLRKDGDTKDTTAVTIHDNGDVGFDKYVYMRKDLSVNGRISCGGLIAIVNTDSNNTKKYLSCSTDGGKLRQFAGAINADESFTIEMVCSRELKENIVSISTEEATSTLEHLNPVKYDYIGDKAFRQNIGFIAEEMPDNLASYDKKSLSPFEVTPILTKVLQEQQKTIALLQQRLDEFERSR
jgi:Chaperone of endosialidase